MALDLEVIRRRIGYIERNLLLLEDIARRPWEQFSEDAVLVEASKYLLQTAIEAMIDIAGHIVARKRLPVPENSAALMRTLAEAHLIPRDHAETYVKMVKFRNVLVHLYAEVSAREVYDILTNELDDFRQFIQDVWQIIKTSNSH